MCTLHFSCNHGSHQVTMKARAGLWDFTMKLTCRMEMVEHVWEAD